jgi:PST family polysaccharide transporter
MTRSAKDVLWQALSKQLVSQLFARILSVVSLIILAKVFEPSAFGNISGLLAIALLISPLVDAGVDFPVSQLRFLSRKSYFLLMGRAIFIKSLCAAFICVLYLTFGHYIIYYIKGLEIYFPIVLLISYFRSVIGTFSAHLRAIHRFDLELRAAIISRSLEIIILFILIKASPTVVMALVSVLLGAIISFLVFFVYTLSNIRHQIKSDSLNDPSTPSIKDLCITALPFFCSSIAVSGYTNANQVFVYSLSGDIESAWYRAATLFPFSITAIVGSLNVGIYSLLNRQSSKISIQNILYNQMSQLSIIIIPAATLIFLFSKSLLNIFFGPEYTTCAPIMMLAGVYVLLVVVSNSLGQTLGALGLQRYVLALSLINLIISLLFCYTFIPTHGALGAVISVILVESFSVIFLSFTMKIKLSIEIELKWCQSGILYSAPLLFIAVLFPHTYPIAEVTTAIVLYMITVFFGLYIKNGKK